MQSSLRKAKRENKRNLKNIRAGITKEILILEEKHKFNRLPQKERDILINGGDHPLMKEYKKLAILVEKLRLLTGAKNNNKRN